MKLKLEHFIGILLLFFAIAFVRSTPVLGEYNYNPKQEIPYKDFLIFDKSMDNFDYDKYDKYYNNAISGNDKNISLNDDFLPVGELDDVGLGNTTLPKSYLNLLSYVLPSPDQHQGEWGQTSYINAGSCLFMALTGAMEILWNKDKLKSDIVSDGITDISERWFMNMSNGSYSSSWLVNDIYIFNHIGGAILNKDYRYTKGWDGTNYSVKVNWTNELPSNWQSMLKPIPKIERKLLFGKRDLKSRYDVAVMSDKIVERIKRALIELKGPVLIVFNDPEIWHAVLIVGYDDNASVDIRDNRCPYVKTVMSGLSPEHRELVKESMSKNGGCKDRGVFYVRESEYYPDSFYQKLDLLYDYDLKRNGEEQPYVAPYIKRSYDWVKYLASYAIAIYRK